MSSVAFVIFALKNTLLPKPQRTSRQRGFFLAFQICKILEWE